MRKRIKIKYIIGLILAIVIVLDSLLNDSILLTKFSKRFTDFGVSIGGKAAEWYTDKIMQNK